MGFQSVQIKAGSMRKAQDFTIYPNGTSAENIIVQSDNRIGSLNKKTGEFKLTPAIKGHPGFHALAFAKLEHIPDELREEIRRAYNAAGNGRNGQINIFGSNKAE